MVARQSPPPSPYCRAKLKRDENIVPLPNASTRLSAIIITLNEEEDLPDCLRSLKFCDEIIVVDNGSSDDTVKIAIDAGARVFQTTDWPGFGLQKQRALNNAKGDWIISVDADERVSPLLAAQILSAISNDGYDGFRLNRVNFFLGREMKYGGWSPDYILRVARRTRCSFDRSVVHEALMVDGTTNTLRGPLLHFSYKTIDEVLEKHTRYAKLGATKILDKASIVKQSGFSPITRAIWTFVRHYFLKMGFLDGWRGSLAASAKAYETFWRYTLAIRRK